ncbi:MAG: hypothetical protein M1816_002110 [Peltula sp. TS41687]|nr:MAG: hypothetical protein M1816_002110 [Peltula sp. TS41687]
MDGEEEAAEREIHLPMKMIDMRHELMFARIDLTILDDVQVPAEMVLEDVQVRAEMSLDDHVTVVLPRQIKKRHRSIERYEPVGKRRRNTSSISPITERGRNMVDSSDPKGNRHPPGGRKHDESLEEEEERRSRRQRGNEREREEAHSNQKTETELREALLREKVKSLRRASNGAGKGQVNR